MKKILIVEDDVSIRNELQKLLVNSGYETIVMDNFENQIEFILESKADLILLDINIPILNGEMVLKELRKKSDVPVIMVTSRTSEVDEVLSMSYGADDFITKPYNPTVLLLRIQNIFKRMEVKTDNVKYNNLNVELSRGIIKSETKQVVLTKNEMIIFQMLLNNRNRIVSRDELMTDLWDNNEFVNDNALTVNISRLRGKLTEIGYEDAIETTKKQVYCLTWSLANI